MISFNQQHLQQSLELLWGKKGCPVLRLETGDVPLSGGGLLLCINFIPNTLCAWSTPDEMVRCSISFLVRKGITKQFSALQWAINAERIIYGRRQYAVVAKYWCDTEKLRCLERSRFSIFNPLNRMPLDVMLTGRDFRGEDPDRILEELIAVSRIGPKSCDLGEPNNTLPLPS
jgi:hypothetical protein